MKQLRQETQHLRELIDQIEQAKNCLALFQDGTTHEINESTFESLEQVIDELEDVYIARINATKRK